MKPAATVTTLRVLLSSRPWARSLWMSVIGTSAQGSATTSQPCTDTTIVLGQLDVNGKTNEIPMQSELLAIPGAPSGRAGDGGAGVVLAGPGSAPIRGARLTNGD